MPQYPGDAVNVIQPGTTLAAGTTVAVYTTSPAPTIDGWRGIYPEHECVMVVGSGGKMILLTTGEKVIAQELYSAAGVAGIEVVVLEMTTAGKGSAEILSWYESIVDFVTQNPIPGLVKKDKDSPRIGKPSAAGVVMVLLIAAAIGYGLYLYHKSA